MDPMSAGLINMEIHRGDGSLGTFIAVQAGLAMQSIAKCGSEEQKQRWLPPMARLDKIGAFALTEPEHGSDSVALETSARRDGESYVINGDKKWIGNGTIADVVVVWARDTSDNAVKGFLVEKGTPGYNARSWTGKASLRAVWQAEINFDDMRVPAENRLPGANSFKDCARILTGTRMACAWMALGHAVAGFDVALTYAKRRKQFGKSLGSFQIIQQRLVKMLAEVTAMQLYCMQIAKLDAAGKLHPTLAGLAKMHNTSKARQVLSDARDLLGGNGILLDLPRDPAHGRPRVHPHLRGHRDGPDPAGRPGHHRRRRLRLRLDRGSFTGGTEMPTNSYTSLTPLAFLERAADVFADKTAIAYGDRRMSYSEFGAEATRLAHALRASGVQPGDRVAYMCPNIPEMLVANFGVPLAGAVLVPINTRLSAGGGPLHLRPLRSKDARRRHRVPDRTGTGARLAAHRRGGRGHRPIHSARPRPMPPPTPPSPTTSS